MQADANTFNKHTSTLGTNDSDDRFISVTGEITSMYSHHIHLG